MTPPDPWLLFWRSLTREMEALIQQHGEPEGIRRFQDQLDARAKEQRR